MTYNLKWDIVTAKLSFEHLNLVKSILACLFMGSFYVISLYLWSKQNRFNRNDPAVIKRRFISVILTCILSLLFIYAIGQTNLTAESTSKNSHQLIDWIGFRLDLNTMKAVLVAIFLTAVLFAGPLVQYAISEYMLRSVFQSYDYDTYKEKKNEWHVSRSICSYFALIKAELNDICFWRNYVISPFTEEFVFRSCMLPLLVAHFDMARSVLIAPLFFGLAHLHHIVEGYFLNDIALNLLIGQHLFQFLYTYVFGMYSSYLFLRTGSFFSSFVSHSFCNFMGFPNLRQLFNDFENKTKSFIVTAYFVGLVSFLLIMNDLTWPEYYENMIYYFKA
jgi:prenyl protein peptidase